jgi:hypothetical protein
LWGEFRIDSEGRRVDPMDKEEEEGRRARGEKEEG